MNLRTSSFVSTHRDLMNKFYSLPNLFTFFNKHKVIKYFGGYNLQCKKKSFKICQYFCIEIAWKTVPLHVSTIDKRNFFMQSRKLCIRDASGSESGYTDLISFLSTSIVFLKIKHKGVPLTLFWGKIWL